MHLSNCMLQHSCSTSLPISQQWLHEHQLGEATLPGGSGLFVMMSNMKPGSLSAICRSSPFACGSVRSLMAAWKDSKKASLNYYVIYLFDNCLIKKNLVCI